MENSHETPKHEPEAVAIVGIGCRFPGKIDSPRKFWEFLTNSGDAIGEIPQSRFDIQSFYDPRPATPGKVMTRWGGFLEDIDQFDADFFGISPREADRLDPQQRLLLEVAWETLEDAGETQNTPIMVNSGVFVGVWLNDFEERLYRDPDQVDFYMTTGSGRYSLAGRLSYFFGMQGPSLTVDTACSSSLVAVYQACQNLLSGQCDMALAGGVNVILQPNISIAYSQSRMMAPDGKCKFGDSRADGYVRSEGAALVALKRLSDALADGNPIYAVIRGGAINNDGRSSGYLTTPGGAGQEDLLRKAYRNARISPAKVQYVEAHGTGTRAGDPVEIQALSAVLSEDRPTGDYCKVGSVKSNFGHTEGAAGIAGMIKVALSLKHQYIPASLHYQSPNPSINWDTLSVRIQSEGGPWPEHNGPAYAGVSAFGIAGTNAHIVLEEAPRIADAFPIADQQPAYLLPLSARSPKALRALVEAYLQQVKAGEAPALADMTFTAAARRNHHSTRAAFVAHSGEDLAEQLAVFLQDPPVDEAATEEKNPAKIMYIFPGQGSQWVGMSRQLMNTQPAFRAALEKCSAAIQPYTGWSLIEILNSPRIQDRLEQIDFIQPALFAMQVSFAAQWMSWGVAPDAIVGHSMGEVAAAYIAGAISLDDAARVICYRSQLMKTVSGKGAMAVVNLTIEQAQAALVGFEGQLSIAVSNSQQSTVISGDAEALDVLTAQLQSQEVFTRRVKVDVAAHSPHMEPLRPQLEAMLSGLEPQPAAVPIFSTVTGELRDGMAFDIDYWGSNLRQPVLFSTVIQKAIAQGFNVFIEMSPHPVLLAAVEQSFPTAGQANQFATLPSSRRNEEEHAVLLQSLGKLYELGYAVDWKKVYPTGRVVQLPNYPWQRELFWLEIEPPSGSRKPRKAGIHPLKGSLVETAAAQESIIHQLRIDQKTFPELYAHRLYASTLLGASAFLELLRASAQDVISDQRLELRDVHFERALVLSEAMPTELQIQLDPAASGTYTFQIFSRGSQGWLRHVHGSLTKDENPPRDSIDPEQAAGCCPHEISSNAFYQKLSERHIYYDAILQSIQTARRGSGEAWASIKDTDTNPRLLALDPLFQLPLTALPEPQSGETVEIYIPVSIGHVFVSPEVHTAHSIYARVITGDAGQLTQDVAMLDAQGQVVAELRGIQFQLFGQAAALEPKDFLYRFEWQLIDAPVLDSDNHKAGGWLILTDGRGIGQEVAELLARAGRRCEMLPFSQTGQLETWIHEQAARFDGKLEGILHLWSLDHPAPEQAVSMKYFEQAQEFSTLSALQLVKQIATNSWKTAPRIWYVTRGDFSHGAPALPPPDQAPMWGLGRVIAEEHPNLWGGLVQIDGTMSCEDAARQLNTELLQPSEPQLAIHASGRYALRVVRQTAEETRASDLASTAFRLRPDSTYLITGGAGGVGIEVAKWMIQNGARRLILMGRTPLPERKDWQRIEPGSEIARRVNAVRELEAMGAAIHIAAVDVGDKEQLSAYLDAFNQEGWPAIRGVMHAAGAVRDRLVIQTSQEDWQAVMRPKVRGAWLLHELLPDLDFFILFSSIGAVLGPVGQGSYAAANAFLDSFASFRRSKGLPALSINWGFWKDTGMQKAQGAQRNLQSYEQRGFSAFTASQGLSAMAIILKQNLPHALVMPVDWEKFRHGLSINHQHLFANLLAEKKTSEQKNEAADAEAILDIQASALALPYDQRKAYLENCLKQQIAQVLKLSPTRILPSKPLGALGLDSLMAIELRGKLEEVLKISLSATFIWSYPTLAQLTPYIAEKMAVPLVPGAEPEGKVPAASDSIPADPDEIISPLDTLLAAIENLSDENIQQSFLKPTATEDRIE